jgi:hypothetical protein
MLCRCRANYCSCGEAEIAVQGGRELETVPRRSSILLGVSNWDQHPRPIRQEISEQKAQLECRYREAKDAFNSARTAIRQKVGRSEKDECLDLAAAADHLQLAGRESAKHLQEHGCGILQEPATYKPIW